MTLEKNYSSVFWYVALFLVQTAPLRNFHIPQYCHPTQLVDCLKHVAIETKKMHSTLILTVLAESAHEPWRTVTWPVVFITHASVLTNWAGFCAAWTPETLRTHCKKDWYSHFNHRYLEKCEWLLCAQPYKTICLYSQFSQCFPDVPPGHLHCPVTLSHGAPVQLQGCTQPVPNLPSGQSGTGHTEEICFNTGGQKKWRKISLKVRGKRFLCRATYPDHSSLRDDQEGIYVCTLQTRDHMTLLVDRRTSSHSRLHKYPGCILETEQNGALTMLRQL